MTAGSEGAALASFLPGRSCAVPTRAKSTSSHPRRRADTEMAAAGMAQLGPGNGLVQSENDKQLAKRNIADCT